MNITIYGIPNCDTVKKASGWFKQQAISYSFYDYKQAGISKEKLISWCRLVGWEVLLNKKSTTWRNLSPAEQLAVTNQQAAVTLMQQHTSIIKRPVIEYNGKLLVGFNENTIIKFFQ